MKGGGSDAGDTTPGVEEGAVVVMAHDKTEGACGSCGKCLLEYQG